jgi:hypothetical protein
VNPAHVEQLCAMFPQLERRTLIWNLQRFGGDVARVTEMVLSGRGLDMVCLPFHFICDLGGGDCLLREKC